LRDDRSSHDGVLIMPNFYTEIVIVTVRVMV